MIEFMRGMQRPVVTMVMFSPMKTASKARVNLVSRSRIKYFTMAPLSWRSMTRFLASCVAQSAFGCAVAPRMWTRRLACSMTAKT